MRSVELFAGAGGLSLGLTKAGFHHNLVLEWDKDACETIRENQRRQHPLVSHVPLLEFDATKLDYSAYSSDIELLAGGPPCQPFSLGGKHRGHNDHRNLFPEMFRAVRELTPKVVLIENVKGLLRQSFSTFFEHILLQLTYPELTPKKNESLSEHLTRLEKHHTRSRHKGLKYNVVFRLVNAANFGVPQRRERVFIVAVRSDLNLEWSFPDEQQETHSQDALLRTQWVTGDYWDTHKVATKDRPVLTDRIKRRIKQISHTNDDGKLPWVTVRDAIGDLPDPKTNRQRSGIYNHVFNPGARQYPGHTGSPIDEPAKTLKAGDHGVPGGENMLTKNNGEVRYFTVRESARLQTFPDDYVFTGSWSEIMRQLGNAVPVELAESIGGSIRDAICKT
ncbi:MAG: DNA cytosine methyltransferase [Candidatus Thiodiazotropha sp. (ex Dulcina madagascariensis)]|nr:DNA cytosine methyltransferase [Candidatus Thiodiazotropha sp. (ex Dulcina madagascariensis)]MCU7927637.1 DNA cytosine methyltransferase [Candidatus Thiodiazotropha sp. (ex Dulcina madagascariensis)]